LLSSLLARFIDAREPRLVARLAECRTRFANSLVGKWTSVQGTFDAVMMDVWEFRSDGTAVVHSYGPFGHLNGIEEYRWDQSSPLTIRIGEPPDEDCAEVTWSRPIAYELAILEHDSGCEVVLHETGADGF